MRIPVTLTFDQLSSEQYERILAVAEGNATTSESTLRSENVLLRTCLARVADAMGMPAGRILQIVGAHKEESKGWIEVTTLLVDRAKGIR